MVEELSKLEVFGRAARQLKNKPVNTEYLVKEKTVLRIRRRERREEVSTIRMSSKKFHKAFSL